MTWWPEERTLEQLTTLRVTDPAAITRAAAARERREALAPLGRLNVLAADHPARGVTSVRNDRMRMADRADFLRRVVRVLDSPEVDGVMATMDVLEELLLLDHIRRDMGWKPLLDGRIVVASANRGGIQGSAWELIDPVTGPGPETCAEYGFDGIKLLLRFDESDPASLDTMMWCAEAIRGANALELPVFLEPLAVRPADDGLVLSDDPAELARLVGIATALGDSSRNLWLKLPYVPDFAMVAGATTCPILLLGGPASGNPADFVANLGDAMTHHNVRGVMLGRNVLYPGSLDPEVVAAVVGNVIHGHQDAAAAATSLAHSEGDAT